MKKFVSIIAILLMLSLAACSNQDTPSDEKGDQKCCDG